MKKEIHVNKYFSIVMNCYLQGGHGSCLNKIDNTLFPIIRNDNTSFGFSMLNKCFLWKRALFSGLECILIHIGSKNGEDYIFPPWKPDLVQLNIYLMVNRYQDFWLFYDKYKSTLRKLDWRKLENSFILH